MAVYCQEINREKDYNRSWFVSKVSEVLACIQILTSDGIFTDGIFLPVVKNIYLPKTLAEDLSQVDKPPHINNYCMRFFR